MNKCGFRGKRTLFFAGFAIILALSTGLVISWPRQAEATTTVISTSQNLGTRTISAGDTLVINPGVTATFDRINNAGSVVVMGSLKTNSAAAILSNNGGTVLFLAGSSADSVLGTWPGTISNSGSSSPSPPARITIDSGAAVYWNIQNYGNSIITNYGGIQVNGGGSSIGTLDNGIGAVFYNSGGVSLDNTAFTNKGTIVNTASGTWGTANSLLADTNDGGRILNSGSMTIGREHGFNNKNGGYITNYAGATFYVGSIMTGAGMQNSAGSTFYNYGTFTAGCIGNVINNGTFTNDNRGVLQILGQCGSVGGTEGSFDNYGTLTNTAAATINNQGFLYRECGDNFSNIGTITGNAIINKCSQFPVTHMSDTTASFASLISAPRQLIAEYVTASSQLVGDKIDSVTLKLQKVGSPTGTAQIGIFNSDLSVKKIFATIDVATISSAATDYEFKLPATDPLYTIQSGDRIGLKYTGGSASVGVNVTPDRDSADPFDGTNSYRVRYETSWIVTSGEDMYMILKQTHG